MSESTSPGPVYRSCPNRHLFRPELHTLCPYCGVAVRSATLRGPAAPSSITPTQPDMGPSEGRPASGRGEVTVGFWPAEQRPVVGWLVHIQGPKQGNDHRLYPGNNELCEDPVRGLRIAEPDPSQRSWAVIAYSPRHGSFHLKEGRSRQLIYLNETTVTAPRPLQRNDVLRVGPHALLFVPFCGPHYRWSLEMPLPSRSLDAPNSLGSPSETP